MPCHDNNYYNIILALVRYCLPTVQLKINNYKIVFKSTLDYILLRAYTIYIYVADNVGVYLRVFKNIPFSRIPHADRRRVYDD